MRDFERYKHNFGTKGGPLVEIRLPMENVNRSLIPEYYCEDSKRVKLTR